MNDPIDFFLLVGCLKLLCMVVAVGVVLEVNKRKDRFKSQPTRKEKP